MSRKAIVLGMSILVPALAMAAELRLENPVDGSKELTLAPGESGEIDIILDLSSADSIEPGSLSAFLGATGLFENVPLIDVIAGDEPWGCDIELEAPANLEEFGFSCGGDPIMGDEPFRVLTLVVSNSGGAVGEVSVSFETGARAPQMFGPPPTHAPYIIAPCGFPPGLPNFLYVGDSSSCNTPFVIHLVEASACDGDANGDNVVDPLDAGYVLSRFGCSVGTGDDACDAADVNGDLYVDPLDAGYVLSRFGECP